MIEAELPDGTVLEFPDGTPDAVIDRAVRQQLGATQSGDISQGPEVSAAGLGSAAATIASGAVAEPIAGLLGGAIATSPLGTAIEPAIQQAFPSFDLSQIGADVTRGVREGLTIPPTAAGQETIQAGIQAIPSGLRAAGSAIVAGFDELADAAGAVSPALGAAVRTAPTAAAQFVGVGAAKGLLRRSGKGAKKALDGAAPSIDDLKTAARGLYDELDGSGVTVRQQALRRLSNDVLTTLEPEGIALSPGSFPQTARAVSVLQRAQGQELSLKQLDTVRKLARAAEQSDNLPDARLGGMMVDRIDDFLDGATSAQLAGRGAQGVGDKFRTARQLWGRARRSELVGEAFRRAELSASGFENGLRTEFRSILKSKKNKFFNNEERAVMSRVVNGDRKVNLFQWLGKVGLGEGRVVGPSLGSGLGAIVFGPGGAAAVPIIGTVSQNLAKRMTRGNAMFADSVIRAGSDGEAVVRAYLRHTPKARRSSKELGQLLMQPRVNLEGVRLTDQLTNRAIQSAVRNRAALAASVAPGVAQNTELQSQTPGQ